MEIKEYRVNEKIKASEVRVILPDGKQLGIKPLKEALEIATSYGLDLVEVNPHVNPPVCKIINYSKFKYQQEKQMKEHLRKQRLLQPKEIRLRLSISPHDYEYKINHVKEFLMKGHLAKVTLLLRGGEIERHEDINNLLNKIKSDTNEFISNFYERNEWNKITLLLHPKRDINVKNKVQNA